MDDRVDHSVFRAMGDFKRPTKKEWAELLSRLSHLEQEIKALERKIDAIYSNNPDWGAT
jgi:hypothetical protein